MADRGDNNFIRYIYRGEEGEIIPREATHITVAEDCTFVRANAFREHRNIVEVIFHYKVEKIEFRAFSFCPRLRRVIMPGVKVLKEKAFVGCPALTDVDCGKLEIIRESAFWHCESLMSINLPSTRVVEESAFETCVALTDVKFSSKLERFDDGAFYNCESLERITIPLKDGLITDDNIFIYCEKLRQVDLVEGVELHETIAALHLDEWRNDMNEEIGSIDQILPNTPAVGNERGKAQAIQTWIRSVLRKIIDYQEEHICILDEVTTTLQLVLPRDILVNSLLPFLELPAHTFEEEDQEMEQEDSDDEEEEQYLEDY